MTLCLCSHTGEDHASHEPRVCAKIDCHCIKFRVGNPHTIFLTQIDRYIAQYDTWYDRMLWLCSNLNFICGMNNTEIVWFYWKYVYPKWDPEEEFLTPELKKAIEGDAKPETITRGFRAVKELHPEFVKKYQNLRMWQSYQEAGYSEGAIALKT